MESTNLKAPLNREIVSKSAENRLLAALPRDSYQRLEPDLQLVNLTHGQVLYEFGAPVDYVYFPQRNAMVSLLCTAEDGSSVEVGVTGWEGMVGISAFMGGTATPYLTLVQMAGAAHKLRAEVLLREFRRSEPLQTALLRYASALLAQISQTALCNRIHTVEERLSRWILVSQDRTEAKQLPLTHEFLAHMLGTSRSTVSLTAATLQQAGLIRYTRGKISVVDRDRLETVACSCYAIVKRHFESAAAIPIG
ncbi:MAG TPA: Crp/Fnr family transcriptional regulator [Terriglobales bacterium]|nr:Crp/Fnr family transcriptional regulator [Terriglobales bacterium]